MINRLNSKLITVLFCMFLGLGFIDQAGASQQDPYAGFKEKNSIAQPSDQSAASAVGPGGEGGKSESGLFSRVGGWFSGIGRGAYAAISSGIFATKNFFYSVGRKIAEMLKQSTAPVPVPEPVSNTVDVPVKPALTPANQPESSSAALPAFAEESHENTPAQQMSELPPVPAPVPAPVPVATAAAADTATFTVDSPAPARVPDPVIPATAAAAPAPVPTSVPVKPVTAPKPAPVTAAVRPRNMFFEDVIGLSEELFQSTSGFKKVNIKKESEDFFIEVEKRKYCCGHCSEVSLATLREGVTPKIATNTFSVIEAGDANPASLAFVDVGRLQANPKNCWAVFQVASNFNALETLGADDAIPNISKYFTDKTQGPFASISAAPGLIYRHYYYYFNKAGHDVPETWRQRPQVPQDLDSMRNHNCAYQINFLSDLGVQTQNGYVIAGVEKLTNFEVNSGRFKVLYHHNIQVTFGRVLGINHAICEDPNQRIDQIFTAALCLKPGGGTVAHGVTLNNAEFVLQCDYEATLRAAVRYGRRVNGRVKVFLTRVGGGVFGNPQNMIDAAIIRAVNLQDLQDCGLDIILNNYRTINYAQHGSRDDLFALVKAHNGAYKVYINGVSQNIAQ